MTITKIATPSASASERTRETTYWRGLEGGMKALVAALAAMLLTLAALALAGCGTQRGGAGSQGAATATPAASTQAEGKLKVTTSFYAMEDFTKKVGGDHVEVTNLVPAGTEPHEWEPAATDVQAIQESDLLVYNGASMEHWVDDTLASLGDKAPATVRASDGIALRAGDEPGEDDPHVWLNPEYAKQELANIKDALAKADPDNADDYEANYEKWAAEFDALDQEFTDRLGAVPNKTIVVSHEAFGYLADAYGLTQVPITGMDAEGEPDAKTMAQIIDQVKAQSIKVIFSEDLVSPKVAQQIADATGATCEVLNPLEGLTDEELAQGEDYVSVMRANLDELVKALS